MRERGTVLLLDGGQEHTLAIAKELHEQLGAFVVGGAPSARSACAFSPHFKKCVLLPAATDPNYQEAILRAVEAAQPDFIIPVTYASTKAVVELQKRGALRTTPIAPNAAAFDIAENKTATAKVARECGIKVPTDFTSSVAEGTVDVRFPLIAKAENERGSSTISLLHNAEELADHMEKHAGEAFLYQEFIAGDSPTFAHHGFFVEGDPILEYQHAETRSVPRIGGSGTRVETISDPVLEAQARALLKALKWTGLAQVEFKKNSKGELVLMEINPKLWASYAAGPGTGSPLVSTALAWLRGENLHRAGTPENRVKETSAARVMAFPLREWAHLSRQGSWKEVPAAFAAMFGRGVRWNVGLRDFTAHRVATGARSPLALSKLWLWRQKERALRRGTRGRRGTHQTAPHED